MQNVGQNKLYRLVPNYVPKNVITNKNRNSSWVYGYNEKYDLVIISKTGELGEVYDINGLKIGLPKAPESIDKYKNKWHRRDTPKVLEKIQSIFQWNDMPSAFKNRWVDYIEEEFDRREEGYWFINDGTQTYITGAHYMYLQWTNIDVGYPKGN